MVDFALMLRTNDDARDMAACLEITEMMAEHGTVAVPTLVNNLSMSDAARVMAMPGTEASLPSSIYGQWMSMASSPQSAVIGELRGAVMQHAKDTVPLYRKSGVTVLAGTDVGNMFLAPGATLLDELELLVEAGLTDREALAAATTNPARVFEIEGLGCLAAGCTADLVLLDHNPIEAISNVRSIAGVVLAGTYHPKPELDAALAAVLEKESSKAK
jgi:imidazolonepropionase-like amidohydrolase